MWRLQYQINGGWQCHSADLLLFVASKYSVISLAQSRWYFFFFFFFHKTPFIFYPRTLSTPTSHPKSINIRKLSDISCSVQCTANTLFNTFLNLQSSQIKIWKLCVNVIFSLAFQKCFKLSAWSWRFACFSAVNAGMARNKSSRLLLRRVGII